MSWLPGTASTGRCRAWMKRRAAANWPRRARCVMSPPNTTRSGRSVSASACKACTTGSRSVPKWVSEICSTRIMPPPAAGQATAPAGAAARARPGIAVASATRRFRHPWPP
ncbi:Uncharacterised protein [Bordetella pertussis]|nr:Uncharacterised protein [Bordetella pertussis]